MCAYFHLIVLYADSKMEHTSFFIKCNKCGSQSVQHIFIKKQATYFGYKTVAIISLELQVS